MKPLNASMVGALALAVETHGVTCPAATAKALEARGLVTRRQIPFAGGFEIIPTQAGRDLIESMGGPREAQRR